jgi:ABC-type transport system substrate-binding protein
LSPTSTPAQEYIETIDGDLIGTGPFVYDYYIADTEVKFHRWERYWRTGAFFECLTFSIIEDATKRNNAMLGHTIDYLIDPMYSLFPTFDADPTIRHKSDIGSLSYYYLSMNTEKINRTWRQAISHAINYTYIINELQNGSVFRSNGPLAPDFPGYNSAIQAATYNLTKAREIVVSMGFGNMSWNDAQWQAATFANWNYTNFYPNDFKEDLLILLQSNLALIGIEVLEAVREPWWWIWTLDEYIEWMTQGLTWLGWGPDYLSPYNMIFPLFSNRSGSNYAYYFNQTVEMWLDDVLSETNATKREELYSKILHQIVEIDMPHAFGYHPYLHYVHSADIHGVPYNSMNKLYVYPMYRAYVHSK